MTNPVLLVDPNSEGGHIFFCRSLSTLLSKSGRKVIYLNREAASRRGGGYGHIAVGSSGRSLLVKLLEYWRIYATVRRFSGMGYTVLFESINSYLLLFVLLLLATNSKKSRWLLTLHNVAPHTGKLRERLEYSAVKFLAGKRFFDLVIYHYEFLTDLAERRKYFGSDLSQKMRFVPHHLFPAERMTGESRCGSTGFLSTRVAVNLLAFGVIRKNKGIVEFLEALGSSDVDISRLRLIIAGRCDVGVRRALVEKISILASSMEIVLLDRYIDEPEKASLFGWADYVLLPYREDFLAQSGIALDAYNCVTPIIASQNPSLSNLVRIDGTGYVFNRANFDECFGSRVFDKQAYQRFVNNIQAVVKEKYGDASVGRIYDEIIG